MPVSRQQIIIRVFRKYSHSLGPDELEYLEEVLKQHDIPDEDVEMSIELIAKEYNKQDGLASDLKSGLPELTDLGRSREPERGRVFGS
ncbi:hypothetical protein EI94DRAFT_55591 [Lactarius quietus]|nr:hypothetical protein EI94DRAFT_55591 [Lactarius quietus]